MDAYLEINDVAPLHALCGVRTASSVQFTVGISHRDSLDMSCRVKSEEEEMLVENIKIVKCPSGGIIASFVRLNLGDNAVKQPIASGIYLNAVKDSFDVLPSFPNGELGRIGNLLREQPADCDVPCEVQSAPKIVNGISDNQRQIIQSISEVWNFMLQRLATVRAELDCGSATIF